MADESARLYVGNLPYVVQKQDIENLFQQNNVNIKKVDISIDPFTGRNPSYCFVDFEDQATAQHVLDTMQGLTLQGRPIRINPKTERKAGERNRLPTKTYDRGWKAKEVPSQDADPDTAYVFDRWKRDDAQSHWTAPAEEGRRLYVGGLPRIPNQDSLNVEMKQLFKAFPVQAVSKLNSPRNIDADAQGSLYFCYVDLETAVDAKNAITMLNGLETPTGGSYKIRPAHFKPSTRIVTQEQQLGTTSKLFVGNLPEFATQDDLEAQMRNMFEGLNVRNISRLLKPNPSKLQENQTGDYHYCFVELGDANEAQTALDALDGKPYKVSFAREQNRNGTEGRTASYRNHQQDQNKPPVNRNLGGSWRRAD